MDEIRPRACGRGRERNIYGGWAAAERGGIDPSEWLGQPAGGQAREREAAGRDHRATMSSCSGGRKLSAGGTLTTAQDGQDAPPGASCPFARMPAIDEPGSVSVWNLPALTAGSPSCPRSLPSRLPARRRSAAPTGCESRSGGRAAARRMGGCGVARLRIVGHEAATHRARRHRPGSGMRRRNQRQGRTRDRSCSRRSRLRFGSTSRPIHVRSMGAC